MERKSLVALFVVLVFVAMLYASNESETDIGDIMGDIEDNPFGRGIESEEELEENLRCLYEANTAQPEIYGNASIQLPAVDEEGKGATSWLYVSVMPGQGRTLTDINSLLFWVDTQYSIQIAKAVAANRTNTDVSNIDIIYQIDTIATLVEGPSAGAALTIATVAALTGQQVSDDVLITGTINPDGTIGPVGSVLEKALATEEIGAKALLVPEGQSQQTTFSKQKSCRLIGPITYCTEDIVPKSTDIEKQVGIDVIEVGTIEQALKYFFD